MDEQRIRPRATATRAPVPRADDAPASGARADPSAGYPGRELEAMAAATNYYRWLLEVIAPYVRGRVAEVGAGTGTVSQGLLGLPVASLHAFEPAPELFAALAERLAEDARATAVHGPFATDPGDPALRFDCVVYLNVLEHIADDEGELRRAYAAMAPGAHLVVYSPALGWLFSEFDRAIGHVRRYTRAEIGRKLSAAGLEVVHCRYMDLLGVLPWYLAMVWRRGRLDRGKAALYDRWAVPLTRRLERWLPTPLGKNVLAIGRKRDAGRGARTAP